jgi:hypothetical protein
MAIMKKAKMKMKAPMPNGEYINNENGSIMKEMRKVSKIMANINENERQYEENES